MFKGSGLNLHFSLPINHPHFSAEDKPIINMAHGHIQEGEATGSITLALTFTVV